MSRADVGLDRDGPVVTVTLRRPDVLNAQLPQMWATLCDISRDLPGDVRVVVVRGAGRAFSAGLDRSVLAGTGLDSPVGLSRLEPGAAADRIAQFQAAFTWLRRPDLITVAAVAGPAVGAGMQLALACDLRILAEDAELALPEVSLGLVPDLGATGRLVELVGYARALELCLTGRRVGAAEADRLGLANLVVPRAELDDAVADLVAAVLAADRGAATELKALLSRALRRDPPAQDRAEREAQVRRLRDLAGAGE